MVGLSQYTGLLVFCNILQRNIVSQYESHNNFFTIYCFNNENMLQFTAKGRKEVGFYAYTIQLSFFTLFSLEINIIEDSHKE